MSSCASRVNPDGCESLDLPGDAPDGPPRKKAAVNGLPVASIYAPNGNPPAPPGPKFDYKLAWLKRLNPHAAEPTRLERLSCCQEITTLCRQTSTSTRRSSGIARSIPKNRCTRFGIHTEALGTRLRLDHILRSSALRSVCKTPASIVTYEGWRTPVTTRPYG